MNIYRDINQLPKFKNAVVTLGSFDGVHLGHIQLITKIKSIANDIDGTDVVVTFHPHPRSVIFPHDNSLVLLNSLEEKLRRFEQANVSNVVIVPFTPEFSQNSPREYIENFILKSFEPSHLVIGYDHRFGLNRQGDFALLQEYEAQGKFKLIKIEKEEIDSIAISSTNIRKYIQAGNIAEANSYLGYSYAIEGKVIHGEKIGRNIGFPTANIQVESKHKLIPKQGIYAVNVLHNEKTYGGMLYIGNKPTIHKTNKTTSVGIEVNIFDFKENIYGDQITIEFIDFIREDIKFNSLDHLSNQLKEDQSNALKVLRSLPGQKKNKVAIVVLNYNGKALLNQYLHTLKSSSSIYEFDLIVIDNASSDDSINYLKASHPEVKIIDLKQNYGYAGGYNHGLEDLNYKYFALVNSDIQATNDWLTPLIFELEKDNTIGSIQPKIRALRKPDYFEYAGAAGGYIDWLGYPFCKGRIFESIEDDHGQYDDITEIAWASGAAFVIRSSVFRSLGGFDASFFAHQEEIDLCLRIKRAGYKCMVAPKSIVFHLGGATLDYESPRKTYLNFRNNLSTIVKNYSFIRIGIVIPIRLFLDGIAGIKFLIDGHPKNMLSIIKAHFSFYRNIPRIIQQRKDDNKKIESISIGPATTNGIVSRSILFQYYIKSKKSFSDLKL